MEHTEKANALGYQCTVDRRSRGCFRCEEVLHAMCRSCDKRPIGSAPAPPWDRNNDVNASSAWTSTTKTFLRFFVQAGRPGLPNGQVTCRPGRKATSPLAARRPPQPG